MNKEELSQEARFLLDSQPAAVVALRDVLCVVPLSTSLDVLSQIALVSSWGPE